MNLRSVAYRSRRRPALSVIREHRPPARHRSRTRPGRPGTTSRRARHRPVPGSLVLPEPGPPALPVLPVPLGPLAVDVGRAGRRRRPRPRLASPRRQPPRPRSASPCSARTRSAADVAEGLSRAARATSAPRASVPSSTWWTSAAVPPRTRNAGCIAVDAASPPTTPADRVGVGVRDPERDAVGPGHPAAGHQVEQRVRLVAEYPQEPGHGPLAQARVQGQVAGAELEHA